MYMYDVLLKELRIKELPRTTPAQRCTTMVVQGVSGTQTMIVGHAQTALAKLTIILTFSATHGGSLKFTCVLRVVVIIC